MHLCIKYSEPRSSHATRHPHAVLLYIFACNQKDFRLLQDPYRVPWQCCQSKFVFTWMLLISNYSRQTGLLRAVWHPIDYHGLTASRGRVSPRKSRRVPRITVAVLQGGRSQLLQQTWCFVPFIVWDSLVGYAYLLSIWLHGLSCVIFERLLPRANNKTRI